MKRFLITITILLAFLNIQAQEPQTFTYATKDGQDLKLDLYTPNDVDSNTFCVVYVFGGGFISGQRDGKFEKEYCSRLVDNGFMVVTIDYRLGLVGVKDLGLINHQPLENAIYMATEDAISALDYLIQHSKDLNINTDRIVMVGSSAGAITVLQTDYSICNGLLNSHILPGNFHIAGVVSYAGAIYSTNGKVKYTQHQPAPTMFFHGTADKLVNYKQLKLFRTGFFGSSKIVPRFEKFGYPYYFRRYTDYGHSVAMMGPWSVEELVWFCKHYINEDAQWQVEETLTNMEAPTTITWDRMTPGELYK